MNYFIYTSHLFVEESSRRVGGMIKSCNLSRIWIADTEVV